MTVPSPANDRGSLQEHCKPGTDDTCLTDVQGVKKMEKKNVRLPESTAASIFASARSPQSILRVLVQAGSHRVESVLDSGSGRSIIGSKFVDTKSISPCDDVVMAVGNNTSHALGRALVAVQMHGITLDLDCLVLDSATCPVGLIIGRDAMQKYGLCLDLQRNAVSGNREDRSRWTLYLPMSGTESCALFASAVPCISSRDVQVAGGSTVELSCSVMPPPVCASCDESSRRLVFSGRISSDLEFVSGIFDVSYPRVLVTNRGLNSASVRRGSVLGYLDSAADSTLDLEQPTPVFASATATDDTNHCPSATNIPGLNDDQRAAVDDLFQRHAAVFMRSDSDALHSSMTPHRIELTDNTPIYIRPRKMSPPVADEVERQCLELERLGIIERCESSWNAPIVPIRKKDGTLRLCIDYRRLNQKTVTTRFPMPDVNESVFGINHGVRWFSALDISKAYYHLPLEDSSRDYTAFSTPRAHWRFRRLPFGLKNAPAQFQKEMQTILHGFAREQLVVYLDDILLKETTFERHLQLADDVLTALESQGIKLNGRKCTWFQPEVKFLGHIISSAGLRKSPEYVEQIRNLDRPKTVHQLRQFLGIVNYQRKFVKNCSTTAKPLSAVTGLPGKTVLKWTNEMVSSFEQLKADLQEDITLAFPDYGADAAPLSIWVDASATGAGACLTQEQAGQTRFIAFASMTFSSAQRNYSTTGRELAALRWGVKTFHSFVCAVHFKIFTDHQALMYLHNMRLVNHRLARTVEELADYDFEIIYIPGKSNFAADLLSRILVDGPSTVAEKADDRLPDGLQLWYRPDGGGDALVQCLCHWMADTDGVPANGREVRQKLVDEALRSPNRYGFKLDRLSRQTLRLMRFPGQPLALDMLAVAAFIYNVKIVVHFGQDNPMNFTSGGHEVTDVLHLQCLGGVHFNLLRARPVFKEEAAVATAKCLRPATSAEQQQTSTMNGSDDTSEEDAPSDQRPETQCTHDRRTQCSTTVLCNGVPLCGLLDTGAAVGMISASALRSVSTHDPEVPIQSASIPIAGLCGTTQCERFIHADVSMFPHHRPVSTVLLVDETDSFGHCLLLGVDFLRAAGVCIDFENHNIRHGADSVRMHDGLDAHVTVAVSYAADTGVPSSELIREHQAFHGQLKELREHVMLGTTPSCLPRSLREFKRHMSRLQLREDLLVFNHSKHGSVPVVARDWLAELALNVHNDMAHIGRDKLHHLFSQRMFSPGLTAVITDIVKTCQRCQLYKTSAQVRSPPVQKIESKVPFELVAVDVVMFPRSGRGHLGCLVAVDHCSKWAVAAPIRSKTSAAIAAAFQHRILPALLRVPQRVLSDNGPEFRGEEFEGVLADWNIQHTYSTPHHPEGNGAVERCNRTVGQSLRLLTASAGDWDLHLGRAMTTYNSTRHAEIETSPADFLLRQTHVDGGTDIISGDTQRVWKPGHPGFAPFRVGDRVKKTAQLPGNLLQNKFEARYVGPLTVCKVGDNGITYLVKSASGKEQRAHHSQLRPYYDTPKYLKQLKERIHTSSKESVTSSNKQDADDNLGTSGAIPPNQLQKIRPGILTPVGQEGGASGQRLVPTSALPLARRAGKAQSVVPSRGCLRQPGALRDSRRVRFDVDDEDARSGRKPLHSSPFFRRSRRIRARTQDPAAFEFWEA